MKIKSIIFHELNSKGRIMSESKVRWENNNPLFSQDPFKATAAINEIRDHLRILSGRVLVTITTTNGRFVKMSLGKG